MNEQQLYLFNQGLKELNVSEEESAFLYQLGATLGHHPEILRDSYLAFLRGEEDYEYKPLIGAPLHFHFEGDQVSLTRLDVVFSSNLAILTLFSACGFGFWEDLPLGYDCGIRQGAVTKRASSKICFRRSGFVCAVSRPSCPAG